MQGLHSFRPLTGIMVLIMTREQAIRNYVENVSVPLRGLWFLSVTLLHTRTQGRNVSVPLRGLWFLSYIKRSFVLLVFIVSVPLRGLWFLSFVINERILETMMSFPSPYGDYGSYQEGRFYYDKRRSNVSVPLRGLWFLSAPLINGFIAPSKMPFAGRIFFSSHFSHFLENDFQKSSYR